MGWSVRRWFQRRQRPVVPQGSGQVQVETPEVPTARTQFYERQAVAWLQAEAEFNSRTWPFNSRTWPFLIVSDLSQWARTWLPAGLVDASPAELEAAYVRGEIPYIPFAPSVELAEVVIAQAVEDGIVLLPTPGRLTSTYVHRDPTTEMETARGYGLKVADSAVLEIQSAAGVICEGELGSCRLGAASLFGGFPAARRGRDRANSPPSHQHFRPRAAPPLRLGQGPPTQQAATSAMSGREACRSMPNSDR